MKPYLSLFLVLLISSSSCSLLEEADNEDFNNELISSKFYSPGFQLATGSSHTCIVFFGIIRCWGSNFYGQLGNGTTDTSYTPVTVTGISTGIGIATGDVHSCAVLSSGSVQCWGYNDAGQLGIGTTVNRSSTPVTVTGISTAIAVSAGQQYSCAVLSSGSVQCWGSNNYGQLGNGTAVNSSTPVTVTGISTAIAVSAGNGFTCALLSSGGVQCWGGGSYGQLGNGTMNSSSTPVTVTGISTAKTISTGGINTHTCVGLSKTSLNVQCWGTNAGGKLGDGTNIDRSTPVTITF